MEISNMKKDLQKMCKQFRNYLDESDYPKAMMNQKQILKNTATINCGGNLTNLERARVIRDYILSTNTFEDFKEQWKLKEIRCENTSFGDLVIRINY